MVKVRSCGRALTMIALTAAASAIACGGDDEVPADAPAIDAPLIDAADAPLIDAPDAPPTDAADAPLIDAPDAPTIDAPTIDAPTIDAPDAPTIDAPTIDAIDAAIDAAPDLGPWPIATAAPAFASHSGLLQCHTFTHDRIAWGTAPGFGPGAGFVNIMLDDVVHDGEISGVFTFCSAIPIAGGHLVYVFPFSSYRVRETILERWLDAVEPVQMLAADPAGGVLVVEGWGTTTAVLRLTADLQVDHGFGANGRITIAGRPAERLVQGPTAAPFVTVRADALLQRFGLRTGAPVAAFGGAGTIALGVEPADLLTIAPIAADGLALVVRGPAPTEIAIHRIDAAGIRAPIQIVDLGLPALAAHADDTGRVAFSFATPGDQLRLSRLDTATGALDPTFGTGGRATVTIAEIPCAPGESIGTWDWAWRGTLGDGRLAFSSVRRCYTPPGPASHPVYTTRFHLYGAP